jgi:hypothetical protein
MKQSHWRVIVPLIFVLAACGSDPGSPSSQGAASSEYWFGSLPVMVATSDIVVLGTVTEVTTGITEGSPPEEIQLHRSVIHVDETLFASVAVDSTVTVETLELVAPQPDWRTVGSTVVAFLRLSAEGDTPGMYYPINEQSVFLVKGPDVQATNDHDLFTERIACFSLDELRTRIEAATDAVEEGKVSPQQPLGG